MSSSFRWAFLALPILAVVAACGGGGGTSGGGGGGGTPPTPVPTSTPVPTPTPALTGTMSVATGGTVASGFTYGALPGGSSLVFSCGCTAQAGSGTLNADGSYTLPGTTTATPPSPNPTYTTVPGRNYVIVATAPSKSEAWNLEFAGQIPSHNVDLGPTRGASDVYTVAGSLYVYHFAAASVADTAFDDWNLNAVLAWVNKMRAAGGPNSAETTLLNDIAAAQQANRTLYPQAPGWNGAIVPNTTIKNDLDAVHNSGDTALPTPCPLTGSGGAPNCTGTPPI